ncbi:GDSL esterase/lipase [Panicum miliaceum]|uniref:GDSL esterase/lipase n=1 Tax=Panicum miliaceum TaxID=4540 RepID=A0A3L6SII0_PANMI|nr:GDSL esterase/lipase [Panicum miliaceum]
MAGFTVVESGCCQELGEIITCLPFVEPCDDRDEYVFWEPDAGRQSGARPEGLQRHAGSRLPYQSPATGG